MRLFVLLCGILLTGCASTQNLVEKAAITDAAIGFPEIASYDTQSDVVIDHAFLDTFLEKYLVVGDDTQTVTVNLVRYADVSAKDQAGLTDYIERLQTVQVTHLNRDEQLAFWINLYNAETIRVILENYPVDSIRSIKENLLDFKGPWNNPRLKIEGQILTLDDIENKIVRPVFDDPRIHYALNCAAMGCPNLRERAYTRENLDQVLDAQAREFINDPRGVTVEDDRVRASRIFLWYQEDYGQNESDVLNHIRLFAKPELLTALKGKSSIQRYEYDWDLNVASETN